MIFVPSVEELQEFKIQTNAFSPQYGWSMGNALNAVTKSGGNAFHGGVFEFLRNARLDANNFFGNRNRLPRPNFKRNQFGANLGGPLRKDKTFFYGSLEGLRQQTPITAVYSVPTLDQRLGDFSRIFNQNGSLAAIYDPFTTRRVGNAFVRDPFAGNRIPRERIDPVALKLLPYWPEPNVAGNPLTGQDNFAGAAGVPINSDQYSIRVDHNLTQSQRLFGRWSQKRQSIQGFAPYFGKDNPGGMGVLEPNPRWDIGLGYNYAISPALLVNATLGWGRWVERIEPQGIGFQPSTLGLPAALDDFGGLGAFPSIGATGIQGLGAGLLARMPREARTYALDLTQIRGRHTLTMGFTAIDFRLNTYRSSRANFSFPRSMTQGPNPTAADPTTGNGVAALLLGTGASGGITLNANAALNKTWYGWYFNDDFKLRRNVTLNLGFRYDFQKAPTDRFDRLSYWALDRNSASDGIRQDLTGGLRFLGGSSGRSLYDPQYTNLAPRIGLTWSPFHRLVVRSGFGMFYIPAMEFNDLIFHGFSQLTPYIGSLDGITPQNLLRNPFPSGLLAPSGKSLGDRTNLGLPINAVDRQRPTPYVEQWTFGLQYQIESNTVIEANYVGNHGVRLPFASAVGTVSGGSSNHGLRTNQLRPEQLSLGNALLEPVPNPFFGVITLPTSILAGPTVPRRQLLRPFPQFDDVNAFQRLGAFSSYQAVTLSVNRRFSRGLQFQAGFTASKYITNSEGPEGWVNGAAQRPRNVYDLSIERSPAIEDIPRAVVISYIYELPFGPGRRFALRHGATQALLGGWQVSGITTLKSGFPVSIFAATNNTQAFNGIQRPNVVGDPGLENRTVDRWFNTAAFAQPAPFTFGNAPRTMGYLRTMGVNNFDFSLQKYWRLWREESRLQFRGEFFNLFNRAGLYGPNTSFGDPNFGRIGQAFPARSIQFGLKLYW